MEGRHENRLRLAAGLSGWDLKPPDDGRLGVAKVSGQGALRIVGVEGRNPEQKGAQGRKQDGRPPSDKAANPGSEPSHRGLMEVVRSCYADTADLPIVPATLRTC